MSKIQIYLKRNRRYVFLILIMSILFTVYRSYFVQELMENRMLKRIEIASKDTKYPKNIVRKYIANIEDGNYDFKVLDRIDNMEDEGIGYERANNSIIDKNKEKAFFVIMSKYQYIVGIEKKNDKNNTYVIKLKSNKNSLKNFFSYIDSRLSNVYIEKIDYKKLNNTYEYEIEVCLLI